MILRWLLNGLALIITAYIIDGIYISGPLTAFIASLVLGIVNAIIRPIFLIFTLPLNLLTLGLFTFVINGIMLKLTAALVSGFEVNGVLAAIFGAIILSVVSSLLTTLTE